MDVLSVVLMKLTWIIVSHIAPCLRSVTKIVWVTQTLSYCSTVLAQHQGFFLFLHLCHNPYLLPHFTQQLRLEVGKMLGVDYGSACGRWQAIVFASLGVVWGFFFVFLSSSSFLHFLPFLYYLSFYQPSFLASNLLHISCCSMSKQGACVVHSFWSESDLSLAKGIKLFSGAKKQNFCLRLLVVYPNS